MGKRLLGVLAGEDLPIAQLERWLETADIVVCADAGADRALAAGRVPDLLLGDLDSVSTPGRERAHETVVLADQNATDAEKLLTTCSQRWPGNPIHLIGLEGDLPDHALAALQAAATAESPVRVVYRRGIGILLNGPASVRIATAPDRRVSLLPIVECQGVFLSGVAWPVSDAAMAPLGFRSISNRSTGDLIEASLQSGVALLFVEQPVEGEPAWT